MASDNTELRSLNSRATYGRRDQYPDSLFGEVDVLLILYRTFPLWRRRCLTTFNCLNNCFLGLIMAQPTQHFGIWMTSRAATWNNWISRETDVRTSAEDMVHGRCNGTGECVDGVARSEDDGGEGNRG
jgi:hypothetical protein